MKLDLSEIKRGALDEAEKQAELVTIPGGSSSINLTPTQNTSGSLHTGLGVVNLDLEGSRRKALFPDMQDPYTQYRPQTAYTPAKSNTPISTGAAGQSSAIQPTVASIPTTNQPAGNTSWKGSVGKFIRPIADAMYPEVGENLKRQKGIMDEFDRFKKVIKNSGNLLKGNFKDFFAGPGGTAIPLGVGGLLLAGLLSSNRRDSGRGQNITVNVGGGGRPDLFNQSGVRSFSDIKTGEFDINKLIGETRDIASRQKDMSLINAMREGKGTFTLSGGMDGISNKLAPNIDNQGNLWESVKNNPFPASLGVLGVGALIHQIKKHLNNKKEDNNQQQTLPSLEAQDTLPAPQEFQPKEAGVVDIVGKTLQNRVTNEMIDKIVKKENKNKPETHSKEIEITSKYPEMENILKNKENKAYLERLLKE